LPPVSSVTARMRPTQLTFCILLIAVALAASSLIAQQPDSLLPPNWSPIAIDQPRGFAPANAIQARPIPANTAAQPQPPGNRPPATRQPPVDVRLISAEEPLTSTSPKSPLRLAPRSPNNRAALERPTAATPTNALVSVGGSLCAVLGIFLVVVWCTRRFAPPGTAALPKEAIEALGRVPLTARQQMQLIRVGNKLLLVALSPTGVEPLTEITDPTEVEHLLSLCRRGQKGSSTEMFRQTLAQLAEEPAPRGFVGVATTNSRGGR
jgi:flagellar protein FliO/FliZ